MTIAIERTRALLRTREFLSCLLDPKQTPHCPKYVREQAGRLAKHFPTPVDVNALAGGDTALLDVGTAGRYLARKKP